MGERQRKINKKKSQNKKKKDKKGKRDRKDLNQKKKNKKIQNLNKAKKTKKRNKAKEETIKIQQKEDKQIEKQEKRLDNKNLRTEIKKEKKLTKIWKSWIPLPSSEVQDMMRLRMDDCNWEEFTESGHSQSLNLIPRSDLQVGDMVQLINPMLNPYNISAEDSNIEKLFDKIDIAMYNVVEDPSEKKDLRFEL